jgi:hypothetical protein
MEKDEAWAEWQLKMLIERTYPAPISGELREILEALQLDRWQNAPEDRD